MLIWNSVFMGKLPPVKKPVWLYIKHAGEFYNVVSGHYDQDRCFRYYNLADKDFNMIPSEWKVTYWAFPILPNLKTPKLLHTLKNHG